ncbi:MAG: SpoIVB peptidase S55 domain-containing protein [Peptostreptococcaceae bacterium]
MLKKTVSNSIIYMSLFVLIAMIAYKYYDFKCSENLGLEAMNTLKQNTSKKYVYPLGNLVGIKAETDGVLVLGYEEEDVSYIGGIQIGDSIIKINDKKVNNNKDITKLLNELKNENVKIGIIRDDEYKEEKIKVKFENGKYKLGLWVRDKVSGIGTMTFYDPINNTFFAIGHAITDVDTNKLLKIKEGYLYNAVNLEIIKGNTENVGKINANFDLTDPIAEFNNNSNFGICGSLLKKGEVNNQLIELGTPDDVKNGNAEVIFEDENRNLKRYKIKLEKITDDNHLDGDMVIEVIDKELIDFTGGIIQGMSGIPIIQNNKLIGSITHVFKNNPKKGYGIFINEMLQ